MQAKSLRYFAIAVLLIGCVSAVALAGQTKQVAFQGIHAKTAGCAFVNTPAVQSHTPIAKCTAKGNVTIGKRIAKSPIPATKAAAGTKVRALILAR